MTPFEVAYEQQLREREVSPDISEYEIWFAEQNPVYQEVDFAEDYYRG